MGETDMGRSRFRAYKYQSQMTVPKHSRLLFLKDLGGPPAPPRRSPEPAQSDVWLGPRMHSLLLLLLWDLRTLTYTPGPHSHARFAGLVGHDHNRSRYIENQPHTLGPKMRFPPARVGCEKIAPPLHCSLRRPSSSTAVTCGTSTLEALEHLRGLRPQAARRPSVWSPREARNPNQKDIIGYHLFSHTIKAFDESLGIDSLVIGCSWNANVLMTWAWMLRSQA